MLKLHPRRKTLEPVEHIFELQNPPHPNLYRDIFPYDEIPKMPFNHRVVPLNPPDEIWITDTTFRDGQQSREPFTVKQIVDIYELLHQLGGPKGMIRQCEFFLYTQHDREAVRKCIEKDYKYPEITGWIRAVKSDFQLVKEMGLKETGILVSCSDYHIYNKLKTDRAGALQKYLDIVRSALDTGVIPRCHFEDITRADFYGFVIPFAKALMKLSKEYKTPVKIRACDTLGYGVGYPGASLPRSVNGIIYGLNTLAEVPSECLEWHGHNDFYRAVTNSVSAWLYGCCAVNATCLGIGERTGNTPLEAMVIELISLRGETFGMDTTIITEVAKYFEKEIGHTIPPNQPFVGKYFNVTRAGIHADGLVKDEEIYNIFNTSKLLKRPVNVLVGEYSGAAGIAFWINHNLKPKTPVDKSHPSVTKIKEVIDEQFNKGRIIAMSDEEMFELVKTYLPEVYQQYKDLEIKT